MRGVSLSLIFVVDVKIEKLQVKVSALTTEALCSILKVKHSLLSARKGTYVGDADATVDGERRGQILVKAVEPRPVHFIHQLRHPDHLCKMGGRETGGEEGKVMMYGGRER